jgi:hypothetical protein
MESLRVNFKERQRLLAADLQSEQEYLSGLDQRHNLYQHSPGIVRGLRLRVEEGEDGQRGAVEPGLAIDSQGRDVVLRDEVSFDIEDVDHCVDVWLLHCLQPFRLRQTGRYSCSPETFQRWTESHRVLAVSTDAAALPDAPVDGAIFLGRIVCDNTRDVEYTGLRGGEIADPGGRAEMQVGARTGWDQQGFVVNVADASGEVTPRIAIDKHGRNSFFGTLELLEYRARLSISIFNQAARLDIEAKEPGAAGEDILVEVSEETTNEATVVNLRFVNSSRDSRLPPFEAIEIPDNSEHWEKTFGDFNAISRLVTLEITKIPQAKRRASLPAPSRDDRPPALSLGGGMLRLEEWPEQQVLNPKQLRGCYEAAPQMSSGQGNQPNGLSFYPVKETPEGPPTPRIYSAIVPDGEFNKEQLRVDLGEKKDGDESVRFSLGEWSGPHLPLVPWLTIDGNCMVTVPDKEDEAGVLVVTGSIEQSLITPDPDDPDFKDLLVKAWIEGLQSTVTASTVIDITFENLAEIIETQKDWTYTVRITNKESNEVTAEKVLETLTITGDPGILQILKAGFAIPGNSNRTIAVEHKAGGLTAGELSVEVTATGKVGNFPWWKSQIREGISVVETPRFNLDDLPDEVPPGVAWDHDFTIRNMDSELAFELTELLYQEHPQAPTAPLPGPIELSPQESSGTFNTAHPGGAAADIDITIGAFYTWENGPDGTITEQRTIKVATQLDMTFETPAFIIDAADWEFGLVLENVSSATIAITKLEQRLLGPNGPTGPFEQIVVGADLELQPGTSHEFEGLQGIHAALSATPVQIEVRAEYSRNERPWHQSHLSSPIQINAAPPPPPPAPVDEP